ncbi:MAG: AsmA family protein [Steroidobacteraceae bacterium]
MTKPLKWSLIALAALVLLLAIATALLSSVDVKSRVEVFASQATGLTVAVGGKASVGLLPTLHVVLQGVTVRNADAEIASVGEADIGIAAWSLLRQQPRVNRLGLRDVKLEIERRRDGRYSFSVDRQGAGEVPALQLDRLSLTNASFRYANRQREKEFRASQCSLDSGDLQLSAGAAADVLKNLTLTAEGSCAEVRNELFVGTDVEWSMAGEQGLFRFTPVTMQMLGGKGAGSIDAQFTQKIPTYRIRYAVTRLHLDDLFRSVSPGKKGEGFMDLTLDLTMHGFNADELTRTTQGEASLRGENLEVAIGNLDEKLKRYESSQNFNLVDLGAFFIAGPLGTAVTKGYNFANVFRETEGSTSIRTLVSQWQVEDGVALAGDVAFATQENRLAMKGRLDFVNRKFDDVTVAVLDKEGCAAIEQKIRGPFSAPEIVKPNVIASLTGPFSNFIRGAKKIVGVQCEVFYQGSIPPG